MASYFNLTLDTTGAVSPSISIESGATYATQQLVNCTISTSDSITTGYEMKIWGNVDESYNTNIKATDTNTTQIVDTHTESKNMTSDTQYRTLKSLVGGYFQRGNTIKLTADFYD